MAELPEEREPLETDRLIDQEAQTTKNAKPVSRDPNFHLGAWYAFLTAFCAVGMSVSSKYAGSAQITAYTSNFISSVVGTILTAAILVAQKKPFIPDLPQWKTWFVSYGVALWFFMWGTFRALQLIHPISSWQSMTACLNQALILIIAAFVLSEAINFFKLCVLARNALVIALIMKPAFLLGGSGEEGSAKVAAFPLIGVVFLMVQCTGCAVGAVIQRRLCDHPVESLLFWGFLANVIYWFPPGANPPQARMPLIWPTTADDDSPKTVFSLMYPLLAGGFDVSWYVFTGYGLKQMNAADFFFLMVPMQLVLSCIASSVLFHASLDKLTAIALFIIASGFVIDRWWETREKMISEA